MTIVTLLVAILFCLGVRHVRPSWGRAAAVGALGWLAFAFVVAWTGVLRRFDARPPPMALLFVVILAGGIALARSRVGEALAELPLWLLILVQGFRLPLELVMHAAASEGTMPHVMTWTGYNYDVVTGASAIAVALVVRASPASVAARVLARGWLVLSFVTLATVAVVALLASPMLMRFGPAEVNDWVTYPPFVWLPAVLVLSALAGQLVLVRAMGAKKGQLFEKTTTPAQP